MTVASIGASIAGAAVSGLLSKSGSKDKDRQTQTSTTTTSKNEPWEGAKPYLLDLYKAAGGLAGQGVPTLADYLAPSQYFPYQTTTAYNPDANTLAGLQAQLLYSGNYLPGLINSQYAGYGSALNAANVAQNPNVAGMNQQLAQNTLTAGGQLIGESGRQMGNAVQNFGLASGQATDALGRTLGNAVQNFGLAGSQATGQMGRMLGNTLDDWLATYQRQRGDISDVLQEEWLPGIRSGASLAGQYGGTRQGVAEGVAAGKAQRTLADLERSFGTDFGNALEASGMSLGDTLSNLGRDYSQAYQSGAANTANLGTNLGRDVSQAMQAGAMGQSNQLSNLYNALGTGIAQTNLGAYGQGLDAQLKAMSIAPQIAQLGMMPGQVQQQVGSTLDQFRQQQIDAEKARFDYEQDAARKAYLDAEQRALQNYQNQWIPIQGMSGVMSGMPWNQSGTTTGTQTLPQQPGSLASSLAGGAMLGNSLYQQFANPSYDPQYGRAAGLFSPEVMGAGQAGPPAPSLWQQWWNS